MANFGSLTMKILLSFPGQGTQFPNMLHQLPDCDISQKILCLASEALGEDISYLDSSNALLNTRAVQLSILISGVVYAKILEDAGVNPDYVCGLSIGAFTAAVVAGILDFHDAVRLVSLRGQIMQDAYPQGYGLTSIQGLWQSQLKALVEQVNCQQFPVYIANYNAEDQFVIAGSEQAMLKVAQLALNIGVRKVTKLSVSVPSHCPLLNESAHQLAKVMANIPFNYPQTNYLSSNSARLINQPEKLRDDLAYNMARSVFWYDTISAAYERGVRLAIEMPPGAVLTHLTHQVMQQGDAVALNQFGIKNTVQLVKTLTQN